VILVVMLVAKGFYTCMIEKTTTARMLEGVGVEGILVQDTNL